MQTYTDILKKDPIPTLLAADIQVLNYFVQRDLLDERLNAVTSLWELPEPRKIISGQRGDGSWKYPGGSGANPYSNYSLLETYRQLRILIEKYGFDQSHNTIAKSSKYLFSCQSAEGAMTGILGTQYMPYYQGAIMELLIKAGYTNESAIENGFQWLLRMRQDDGGWLIPMQSYKEKSIEIWNEAPVRADPSKPSSHLATGMVLRSFAAHPDYRHHPVALEASDLLKSRFFKSDKYHDRKAPHYWTKFQYPFWWTNLLTALDSISKIGFDVHDGDIQDGIKWFINNQDDDGLWDTGYGKAKDQEQRIWVGLAICRVLKRLLTNEL